MSTIEEEIQSVLKFTAIGKDDIVTEELAGLFRAKLREHGEIIKREHRTPDTTYGRKVCRIVDAATERLAGKEGNVEPHFENLTSDLAASRAKLRKAMDRIDPRGTGEAIEANAKEEHGE